MTDIQVSNARRVGFTALALATCWVLAWRMYWTGVGRNLVDLSVDPTVRYLSELGVDSFCVAEALFRGAVAALGLIPATLLSFPPNVVRNPSSSALALDALVPQSCRAEF